MNAPTQARLPIAAEPDRRRDAFDRLCTALDRGDWRAADAARKALLKLGLVMSLKTETAGRREGPR